MRLLPRNVPAEGVPEKPAGRGEVVRRYEITVEREFLAVRTQADQNLAAFCPQCGHDVNMLHPDAAAAAGGTSTRNSYRWIEQGCVHFIEPESGLLFVCSESLHQLSRSALELSAPGNADTPKEDER